MERCPIPDSRFWGFSTGLYILLLIALIPYLFYKNNISDHTLELSLLICLLNITLEAIHQNAALRCFTPDCKQHNKREVEFLLWRCRTEGVLNYTDKTVRGYTVVINVGLKKIYWRLHIHVDGTSCFTESHRVSETSIGGSKKKKKLHNKQPEVQLERVQETGKSTMLS